MTITRYFHGAVCLPNGKVLVAGGGGPAGPTNSAELFDLAAVPNQSPWRSTAAMSANRLGPTLTLLLDGHVLAAGGTVTGASLSSCELYDAGLQANPASQPQIAS